MYISDKAVKCDNKTLFNPVIYIFVFVRFRGGEITHQKAERGDLFKLGWWKEREGDRADGEEVALRRAQRVPAVTLIQSSLSSGVS